MVNPVNQQDPRDSASPDHGVQRIVETPILTQRVAGGVANPELIDTPILTQQVAGGVANPKLIDTPILTQRVAGGVANPELIDTPILSSTWTRVKRGCQRAIDTPIFVARWIWTRGWRQHWS